MVFLQVDASTALTILIGGLFTAFVPAVQLFAFFLLARLVFKRFQSQKKSTWIRSTFKTAWVSAYVLGFAILFVPQLSFQPVLPEGAFIEPGSVAVDFVYHALLLVVKSAMLALIAMPFIFVGDWAYSKAREKISLKSRHSWLLYAFVACFVGAYLFQVMARSFEWFLPSILYALYEFGR